MRVSAYGKPMEAIMTNKDVSAHPETASQREGDIGIFQTLGMGLLAFTVLMVLLAIVLSIFLDIGG
jgi:hypothetical protein